MVSGLIAFGVLGGLAVGGTFVPTFRVRTGKRGCMWCGGGCVEHDYL